MASVAVPGGSARLDVEATLRPGPFAVEVRPDPRAPAWLAKASLAVGRLLGRVDERDEPLAPSSAGAARALKLDAVHLAVLEVVTPADTCLDVVGALGAGASGLDLRVVDASGAELGASRGRATGAVRICAAGAPRAARAELRVATGQADALVLVRPAR